MTTTPNRRFQEREASEGVDPLDLIRSMQKTIEGQRKHIQRLESELAKAHAEAAKAECRLYTLGAAP